MDIRILLTGCLAVGIMLWACSHDRRAEGEVSLEGYWGLTQASINGKSSDRLSSLYFEFVRDSLVHTNILGEDASYPYRQTETEIIQQSVPEIVYSIDQLSDTLLTLTTQIQNADFVLHLGRRSSAMESNQITEN